MSLLKKKMQAILEKQDRKQAALAIDLGTTEKERATIESRLSDLDGERGRRFFMEDPKRLEKLATELNVTVEQIKGWATAPTLLVDKELGSLLDFIKSNPAHADRFDLIETSSKEEMRDCALREENATLVVAAVEKVLEFFSGAGLAKRLTTARKVPRGWCVDSLPGLLLVPPPQELKFIADDGSPKFRIPEVCKEELRGYHVRRTWKSLGERFQKAEREGEELLVSLDELRDLSSFTGRHRDYAEWQAEDLRWLNSELWWWPDDRPPEWLSAVVQPHTLRVLKTEVQAAAVGRNPLVGADRIAAEAGLPVGPFKFEVGELPELDIPESVALGARHGEARALLNQLLDREWKAGTSEMIEHLVLRQFLRAEWSTISSKTADGWRVMAHLGGNKAMQVRMWRFGAEKPTAVERVVQAGTRFLNGGDIVLSWESLHLSDHGDWSWLEHVDGLFLPTI